MASKVRVFPAVIALSVGVLGFKGVNLAYAVAEDTDHAAEEQEAARHADALVGNAGDVVAGEAPTGEAVSDASAAQCAPGVDYAGETGISEQEIQVLRKLSDRRQELDDRESEIETREQAAAAAEERLNEQIADLKALEGQVEGLLSAMEAKRDERMDALVKTYESMKPKDAARIFDTMEVEGVLIDLAKSMKPASLAAVMSSMQPSKAEALTKALAALADPPASIPTTLASSG